MKKRIVACWEDVLCAALFVIPMVVIYHAITEWYFNEPFVLVMAFVGGFYTLIAVIRLVLIKKKRTLRYWIYPIYGLLCSSIMIFLTLSADPWLPMNDPETGRVAAGATLIIMFYFVIISSIVRIILRLVKKRRQKAVNPPDEEVGTNEN